MTAVIHNDRYRQIVRELSERIVEAQRPIRILDAIKWEAAVQEEFLRNGCKAQPAVDRDYYQGRPLAFDPADKQQQFQAIERDIARLLGKYNDVGQIMARMCTEYRRVVCMLEARGTPEFSRISAELYGAASDAFHAGDPTIADLGEMMAQTLANLDHSMLAQRGQDRHITGEQAVAILQERFNTAFAPFGSKITVKLSDGILADAAAGADYLKIRKEASFSERDLRVIEVHEGWVHLGTMLNGKSQPVCTFLSKGPPSSTVTQEGLAILMEIIAFASYPARLKRLTNRVVAVSLAEQGANFLEVFQFFREQGFDERESYAGTYRAFRGSTPTGGPFTKDLSYSKGFIQIYNYLRLAVRRGKVDRIPLLFCGKTTLEDVRTLAQLVEEGLVSAPRFLPPQVADLNALTAWMCYSNFFNRLNLQQIEADYAKIL